MKVSRRSMLGGALALSVSKLSHAQASPAPVLYVSHGAPLMVPGNEARVAALREWGARMAKPQAIVVMTPHFAARDVQLGPTHAGFGMFNLPLHFKRLIPQNLDYPTPPSDALATRLEALLGGPVRRNPERRGFDHTTWMPLLALFPAADVPVLELGYPYLPEAQAFALGERLAPLRDEGVLFLASGGMTHNLGMMTGATPSAITEFDAWASECIQKKDADALIDWRSKAPASDLAHPDDGAHFRVLHVAMGVALHARSAITNISFPIAGFEGALSKRCVQLS